MTNGDSMWTGSWLFLHNSIHSASSFTISRYLGYYQNVGVYTHCAGKSLYQWVPRKQKPISQQVLIKFMALGVGHCLTGLKDPNEARKIYFVYQYFKLNLYASFSFKHPRGALVLLEQDHRRSRTNTIFKKITWQLSWCSDDPVRTPQASGHSPSLMTHR